MRALPWCLALFLVLPQCGGGGSAARLGDTKSADDGPDASDRESERDSAGEGEPDSDARAEEKSSVTACDDGTCSPCGSGICPVGWYCDEVAGACSWLTECADKPSCGCVTRVLGSSCKCREEAVGLKVACE